VLTGKVIEALFKPDAIKSRKNIEAIEAVPGTLVAARVVDHKPARIPPFEEVQAQVSERFVASESQRLAAEAGKKKLAEVQANADIAGFGAVKQVSRSNPQGITPAALREITRATAGKLPSVVGVDLGEGGYALYRVGALSAAPAIDDAKRLASATGFSRSTSALELQGVLAGLREQHKAKILKTDLAAKDPDAPVTGTGK
jgi:peptidyl-prolyl cis-trans isomerase D